MALGKFIPAPLKRPLIFLYVFSRCLMHVSASGKAVLNLSGVLPPIGSSKIVHGGKVKLLALRERFGDSWRNFNLAYFVSSGLPFGADLWIKIYKKFGIKVIWNQNGVAYPALYPQAIVERVNGLMKPIHGSDYVVYQTEFTKRCADKFLGVFQGPSSILINPVDTKVFKPRQDPLPIEPLVILMLGNHFESEERMTASLEPLRTLRDQGTNLKLIIIGRTEKDFQEDWIEKHGAYLQSEAPALFQSAHLFLHLKYLDPCPTGVLEALASGMPIIGSRSGGMPELVNDASGVLLAVQEDFERLHYPSKNAVVEAILQIRSNLVEFSTQARKQAEKFNKEIWLERHREIFNSLIK